MLLTITRRCAILVPMSNIKHGGVYYFTISLVYAIFPDRHRRHSMVIVPMDTPGLRILRPMLTYGSDGMLKAKVRMHKNVRPGLKLDLV